MLFRSLLIKDNPTKCTTNKSLDKANTRLPLSNPIMWQFEKENVPPKLFFRTLFWEFVMFFQLSTSFHYSTAKHNSLFSYNNKTSGKKSSGETFSFSNCHIIGLDTGSLVLIVFDKAFLLLTMITILWFASTAIFFISQYNLRVSKIKNHYFISSYFK
jgi:hypothetical protein